ncbi:MAG: hypothetical protein IJ371_04530, partial [Clostridia bacterium]|nr:hypothetical protein [Clostridia bacterium]
SANNIGFTSVLYVKVSFYLDIDGEIQEQCKYFIYEIAVYTPARELRVNTDKDEIIYINENYIDSAIVNFNIELNSATRRIAFSSSLVNNSINLDYYGSGVSSIYGISVLPLENVTDEYFRLNNLKEFDKVKTGELFVDNSTSTRKFSVQALQNLRQLENDTGATSIAFEIAIYQFGQIVETTKVTKVIYFGDYNSADSIIVVSGVEGYSNIYLSLLGGNATRVVEAYASSSQGEVTYKDLGYKLYQEDVNTGEWLPYSGGDLTVDHDINENTFTINASNQGGVYQLELYTKDSGTAEPKLIKITVSDGRTSETAYLIKDLNDFVKLADNTQDDSGNPYYYRLWQDIDISALNSTEWWSKSRQFAGHLDGAMTIEDLNTGKSIYKCYSLMGLNVSQNALLEDANCFGLFNVVTGTIQNVVFESVVIDITLGENAEGKNNTSSTAPTSIGAITAINSGVIENCSVNINSSSITFSTSAQNSTYNIGLIAGLNNNIIKYAHTNFGSNYSHMVDVSIIDSTSGKLTITLIQGNTKFTNTNLYIGGVVGQNANGATISANYEDKSSKEVRELISAVVNIKLVAQYNDSYAPANIDNLGLGGIAGYNIGTIQNIAVSGSIVAN